MRYLSVCSGIEAATRAWRPLGWRAVAFAEIDPFASALLASHYPNVPNLGDITQHERWKDIPAFDILVGGTPCQSFSVAGLRRGLEDPRGSLMLTYLGILDRFRPRWCVWENVPGVLSSSGGRDFGAFLGALGELGYGFAYRVLDAQYVRVESHPRAVPQRRRRVFVVGHLGNWRRAAEVLLEPEGVRGDSAPRREAGKGFARGVGSGPARGGQPQGVAEAISFKAGQSEAAGAFFATNGFAPTLQSANNGSTAVPAVAFKPSVESPCHTLHRGGDAPTVIGWRASGQAKAEVLIDAAGTLVCNDGQGGGIIWSLPDVCGAITDGAHHGGGLNGQDAYSGRIIPQPVVYDRQQITSPTNRCNPQPGDPSFPLHTSGAPLLVGANLVPGVSGPIGGSSQSGGFRTTDLDNSGAFIPEPQSFQWPQEAADPIATHEARTYTHEGKVFRTRNVVPDESVAHTLSTQCSWTTEDGTGRGSPLVVADMRGHESHGCSPTLRSKPTINDFTPMIAVSMAVRRLTPRECERLQGFPDDYTLIEYRGKPAADGNRYKALGNSMAVNVMRFIGERIALIEARASDAHEDESDG